MPDLFTKPLDSIEKADIEGLIGWPESLNVEYKERLPSRDGRQDIWAESKRLEDYTKEKLWREVVAFANTSGGHLIIGIGEDKGSPPTASSIIPIPHCAELAERLQRAAQNIDPPIPLLQVVGIEIEGTSGVVVIRVPESRSAPHRSTDRECYLRRGSESKPMGMREIQDMTLSLSTRGAAIKERLSAASEDFQQWRGRAEGIAFRITAVQIGARFELPRFSGATRPYRLQSDFRIKDSRFSQLQNAHALGLPDRRRSMLRGERLLYSDREDDPNAVRLDVHNDGTVNLLVRFAKRTEKNQLTTSWIVAYWLNVVHVADTLRKQSNAPDSEIGIEVEITGQPTPVSVIDWIDDYGRVAGALTDLTNQLPLLSLGPISEKDALLTIMITDLLDLAGAYGLPNMTLAVVG